MINILHAIQDFSRKSPEKSAFISVNNRITYRELWEQSEKTAAYLLNSTISPASPILVYGHMDPEMLVAFLGSVKSGHAYVPVDLSIPKERVLKIIESSQAEFIINVSKQPLPLDGLSIQVVTPEEILLNQSEGSVPSSYWVKADENFYIIYTSGSTGNPKGVQISTDNLQSFIHWMISDFPITGGLRFLNQAPFSFDLSVMDLYPALASGGTIFAITKELIAKPKILFEALGQSGTQVWTSTPSFVQICLMDPLFNAQLLPDLKVFLFCGEILPNTICKQLMERFPKARIYNTYGPTEATVAVTSVEVTADLLERYPSLPVGKVKADTELLIVDENGDMVATGEKGEIILAGPGVSKGYLGQTELTSKAFYKQNSKQAYKTGDAGYLNKDGLLFYKGRIDYQIKLHGYRMELEEIEYHIANTHYVKAVIVIPIYQNDKIEYLSAAIVPESHEFEKDYQLTAVIKKELAEMLPAYMIPRKFTYHTELPITANGKVDRKQIKELTNL